MIEEGEIITLDNNIEYAVIKKIKLDEEDAFILMTTMAPIKIKIGIIGENEEIILIDDQSIIKEALLQLI